MRQLETCARLIVCFVFLTLASAAALGAQRSGPPRDSVARKDYRYRYRLLGVYDEATGAPIQGVDVIDVLSGSSAKTTPTGTVSLLFLPDSGSLVRVRKIGYEEQTFPVSISPADTSPITVVLRKAVQLEKVTVTDSAPSYISPGLRGFEERVRNHAGGFFITAAMLRTYDDVGSLPDVLAARMPSAIQVHDPAHVHIRSGTATSMGQAFPCADWVGTKCAPASPRGCWIAMYLNGARVYTPGTFQDAPDFSSFQVSVLGGIEYYPHNSSLPQQFSDMSGFDCGTLVLWSREK